MATYYVNKNPQSNGDQEVHASQCSYIPSEANRMYLGEFTNCKVAVREAKRTYSQVNGCYFCCNECHTS